MSNDLQMELYGAKAVAKEQQTFIERLIKEKAELEDKIRTLELEKKESQAVNHSRMAMYEAQAIAIEKQLEIDRLKEEKIVEIDRLRREYDTEIDELKRMNSELKKTKVQIEEKLKIKNIEEILRKYTMEWPSLKQEQKDTILLIGGSASTLSGSTFLVLSCDRSKWIEVQLELPYFPWCSGAVYLNKNIYLLGGGNCPQALYRLDDNIGNIQWTRLADMNLRRNWISNSCFAWDGHIWVIGGDCALSRESMERYDPMEDKWTLMPNMKCSRFLGAAVMWNDIIIVSGGGAGNNGSATAESFSTINCRWRNLSNNMPEPRRGHSLLCYKNKIVAIGGMGNDLKARDDVWELDLEQCKNWKPLPPMKYPSHALTGVVFEDEIYVIGGKLSGRVEIFNGEKWRNGPSLPQRSENPSAIIIPPQLAHRLCSYKP